MIEHDHPGSLVERRIRAAMEAGEFDGLPGEGEPLPDVGRPYREDWWIRKWLERNGLGPDRLAAPGVE